MLNLNEGIYYGQLYFLYGGIPCDIWGAVFRDHDASWTIRFRVRFYRPGPKDPFNDNDRKEWMQKVLPVGTTEEQALAEATRAFNQMFEMHGFERISVIAARTDDGSKILEQLRKEPWFHERRATPEEQAQMEPN